MPGELSVWSLAVEGPSGDITDGWGLSTLLNRRILIFSPGLSIDMAVAADCVLMCRDTMTNMRTAYVIIMMRPPSAVMQQGST